MLLPLGSSFPITLMRFQNEINPTSDEPCNRRISIDRHLAKCVHLLFLEEYVRPDFIRAHLRIVEYRNYFVNSFRANVVGTRRSSEKAPRIVVQNRPPLNDSRFPE